MIVITRVPDAGVAAGYHFVEGNVAFECPQQVGAVQVSSIDGNGSVITHLFTRDEAMDLADAIRAKASDA